MPLTANGGASAPKRPESARIGPSDAVPPSVAQVGGGIVGSRRMLPDYPGERGAPPMGPHEGVRVGDDPAVRTGYQARGGRISAGDGPASTWNAANLITIGRILLVPVFVWLLALDGQSGGPLRW